jgi:ABC-type multidrug transport system fused ATPase/permease subunit
MNVLNQIRRAGSVGWYGRLLAALALPVLVYMFLDFDSARILVSVVSIVLLTNVWRVQIRGSKNIWRSLLWTSVLFLPMFGLIWLGLNVVRRNTYEYAVEFQRHLGDYRQSLYWHVGNSQDWIVWIAKVDLVVSLLIAFFTFFRREQPRIVRGCSSEVSATRTKLGSA